jgi:hypothetical protein
VTTLLLAQPVWLRSPEMRMRSVCRFSGFVQTPFSLAIHFDAYSACLRSVVPYATKLGSRHILVGGWCLIASWFGHVNTWNRSEG